MRAPLVEPEQLPRLIKVLALVAGLLTDEFESRAGQKLDLG
jgi:hypothetical protein